MDEFEFKIFMTKHTVPKGAAGITAPKKTAGWACFARSLVVVLLAASVGACSSFDMFAKKDDTPPDEPADRLYNEGLYLLNAKKDPKEAVKKFEEVDRQHPYSEWARKALIMSTFAYYQAGEYDDCVNSAKRYITLHPGSADAAYAQFLIGSSYFDEIPDITRDQSRTEKALAALDEVIRKYPQLGLKVLLKLAEMVGERLRATDNELMSLRSELDALRQHPTG